MRQYVFVMILTLAAGACGDPRTTDSRGYTKAPLEDPNLLIAGEETTAMAALGEPDLPRPVELEPTDSEPTGDGEEEQEVQLAPGVTQEQYDQGRQLFGGQGACQACHGPDAAGTPLAPDLTDDTWLHVSGPDVDELAAIIEAGVPQPTEHPAPMPPMGGADLNDEQVRSLAGYLASIAPR